jgi:hypothetical protein
MTQPLAFPPLHDTKNNGDIRFSIGNTAVQALKKRARQDQERPSIFTVSRRLNLKLGIKHFDLHFLVMKGQVHHVKIADYFGQPRKEIT